MSAPRHPDSAVVLVLKRFSAALVRAVQALFWWLVAAFSTAGCCYCGYVASTSWNRLHPRRSQPEPAVPLDASDDTAVARYAAAGVRDLEEYLAAWGEDRCPWHGETADPHTGDPERRREGP